MIALLLALTLPVGADILSDPLWDAAVTTVGRSDLLPRAAIVSTTTAGQGTETWVAFHLADGRLESTIAYRREGERVLTEEECARRNRLDTRVREAAPFGIDEIPLQPELQPIVRYRRVATRMDGALFDFTMRRGGHEVAGTVFIAHEGEPRTIEFEPRPLPFGARSIRSSLRLAPASDGRVRLHSMSVNGSAGVLWIDRSFRTEYRFLSRLPESPAGR